MIKKTDFIKLIKLITVTADILMKKNKKGGREKKKDTDYFNT